METTEVAVVGAGFSGIGTAIALERAGIRDFLLLEEGDAVGGAWYWNRYPGIAVDIPSFSYQFSYRQRTDWSRVYATGAELRAYAEECVDAHGVRDRLRLRTKVVSATFDDDAHVWRLGTGDGDEITTRFLIGATGVFTQPKRPQIEGLDDFAGPCFHTARWDHSVDIRGKRVGVIGTGASAVQVVPTIAPEVAELTVFQRTPIWCLPKLDGPIPTHIRNAMDRVPGVRQATRLASQTLVELTFPVPAHFSSVIPAAAAGEKVGRRHLRRSVRDPQTRARLTPDYALGCKRPGFSNDYLRTFNRPNVHLETAAIDRVTARGVRMRDGREHEVDVLILATGFKVFEEGNMPPYPVRGAGGRDLADFWREHRFQAYEGVSVPGFPNLFAILGPYAFNGASYFTLIENGSRHIVRALKHARRLGATRVEVTQQANDRFFEEMLSRRHRQVFFQGACGTANSYYFDAHGDVPFRPSLTVEAAWRSARYALDDYRFDALPEAA